ncbi:transglutaminase family protein [Kineococcus glutinatus]|uniref:Transglutaminase-like domain-containing protein n=1 Tax=Kineococcus glutinatus TaxID=1070872 RepID=A0ABP9HTV6_9ACTN
MITAEAMAAPLLGCAARDLEAAGRVTYRLEQTFRYEYAEPVHELRQRLVVVLPQRHGDVHRRHWAFEVRGAPHRRRVRTGAAAGTGATVVHVHAERVERSIEFRVAALLERLAPDRPPVLAAAALRDPRLLRATALTAADDRLREWAGQLHRPGEPARETAERACAAVHGALVYENGATTTRTTAARALAGGRGVCQDFAHVLLALCHLLRVPARYVSGHLLGQGGTHAWVEVVVPEGDGAVALGFDACNGRRAGAGHVVVATGRDYLDVAPTSGSYVGAPTGRLTSTRSLGVVAVTA